jgi:hypothetical protein
MAVLTVLGIVACGMAHDLSWSRLRGNWAATWFELIEDRLIAICRLGSERIFQISLL